MLGLNGINAVFDATVQATEEAIVNALVAAETMTGRDSGSPKPWPILSAERLALRGLDSACHAWPAARRILRKAHLRPALAEGLKKGNLGG